MDENEVSNDVVESSSEKSLEEILSEAYDREVGDVEDTTELTSDETESSDVSQEGDEGEEETKSESDEPIDPEIVDDEELKAEEGPKEVEIPQETKEYIQALEIEKQISDGFKSVVDPHLDFLNEIGANPFEHAQQLFQLSRALHTSDEAGKASILADLFVGFGVSAELMESALNERLLRPPVDPVIEKLERLEAKLEEKNNPRPAQVQAPATPDPEMVRQITEFSAKHEFFESVKQDMGVLLQTGRANNLQEAYKMACRMSESVQSTLRERAKTTRAASSQSVRKTTSAPRTQKKTNDLHAILSAAYDEGE